MYRVSLLMAFGLWVVEFVQSTTIDLLPVVHTALPTCITVVSRYVSRVLNGLHFVFNHYVHKLVLAFGHLDDLLYQTSTDRLFQLVDPDATSVNHIF